jgi:hypothetical protein
VKSSNLAASALLALAATLGAPARAEDSESFFAQGRTLRAHGKCAEAIVAFRHALDLKPQGLGSLRNVAECEEEIGEFASARSDWWSLRRAVLQSNEPKYQGWERDAEQAYARLEPKMARLTVKLAGLALERVRISIDGKPLDPRLIGVELERDLGAHTVEAFYGGVAPVTEKRTLAAGAREVVTLAIPALTAGEGGATSGDAPAEPGNRPLRTAGVAMLAAGGVGAVGAAIALGVRQSALAQFDVCAPAYQGCPPSLRSALTRGQTASTFLGVFGVVAGVGIVSGIPMSVLGSRPRDPTAGDGKPSNPVAPTLPATGRDARVVLGFAPVGGGAAGYVEGRFW